ncbi:unnamed protein product [Lymnaea stagnalis]|uniref:Uncharacterized protein n=1 Tax=Lymnaea stagnalis TaxID=6523 RepID=A0AAV2IJ15_LYMST
MPTFRSSRLSLSNFSGVSLLRILKSQNEHQTYPLTRLNIWSFLSLGLTPSLGVLLGGTHRLLGIGDDAPEPDLRVGGLSSLKMTKICGETPPLDDCESSMLLIFDQSVTSSCT